MRHTYTHRDFLHSLVCMFRYIQLFLQLAQISSTRKHTARHVPGWWLPTASPPSRRNRDSSKVLTDWTNSTIVYTAPATAEHGRASILFFPKALGAVVCRQTVFAFSASWCFFRFAVSPAVRRGHANLSCTCRWQSDTSELSTRQAGWVHSCVKIFLLLCLAPCAK